MVLAGGIAAPRQKPMLARTGRCLWYRSDILLIPKGTVRPMRPVLRSKRPLAAGGSTEPTERCTVEGEPMSWAPLIPATEDRHPLLPVSLRG
jgi:hypothetical protein